MSRPARSLFLFGVYVFSVGVALLAAPAALAALLRLPAASAGWPRVVGLLCLVIGAYDMVGSSAECASYIRSSVPVRAGFAVGTTLLVIFGQMPVPVLLLGLTDIAGALWTAIALKTNTAPVAQ